MKESIRTTWRNRFRTLWWKRMRPLWQEYQWPVVGILGLTSIGLGYIGFSKYFAALGEIRSGWDIFYLSIQLLTLESGAIHGPVSWELEVARLLARAFHESGYKMVVIDQDEENSLLESCREMGAIVLIGNVTDRELLHKAQVHKARYPRGTC